MIVYVAGPYTKGDVAVNVARAMEIGNDVIDAGYYPIVPHLSHFLHMQKPQPYAVWIKMDLALIEKCDCMIRLLGESEGADGEVALAERLGLQIVYQTENGWMLRKKKSDGLLSALNQAKLSLVAMGVIE